MENVFFPISCKLQYNKNGMFLKAMKPEVYTVLFIEIQ